MEFVWAIEDSPCHYTIHRERPRISLAAGIFLVRYFLDQVLTREGEWVALYDETGETIARGRRGAA